ncbi:MAG: hypothetical protein IH623_07390 [Verrucomicrobia bacterium]|nr:hypothetical protein [Verrucomicrobiota bacterium]
MSSHATSRSGVKFPATPGITHGVSPTPPGGAKILQSGGRGGTGNILYVFPNEQPPLVLKVFRPRRSRFREFLKNFSERVLEGKRGATAAIRCATEKLNLELWTREGFEVVKPVARALPAGLMLPALWLLHCDAPLLWEVLADFTRSLETRLPLVELLGLSLSSRHTRAVELQEPLLIHEHGHIKHFFIREGRLVAFDLEHGFKPGYPVVKAVARELAGITTSLARADAAAADAFLRVFVTSYVNKPLLKLAVREALHGGGLIGRLRRWHERRHALARSKTCIMQQVAALLEVG